MGITKSDRCRYSQRQNQRKRPPREKDENGTNRRMEGKRIEWVEYSHLFRSRRTRVSTRARFVRAPFSRHAVTVVFLEHREYDRTDKNSTNKGLGLSRRVIVLAHGHFYYVIYCRTKVPPFFQPR